MTSRLSQLAYDHLLRQLLTNRLPGGAKVSELALARELGISRTPVREAIRRLQNEGLLYQIPSSGTYVAEPDRKQIIDAHETRLALEMYLIRRAVPRLVDSELAALRRQIQQMRELAHDFRSRHQLHLPGPLHEQLLDAAHAFQATLTSPTDNELAHKVIREVDVRLRIFLQRADRLTLGDTAQTLLAYHHIAAAAQRRNGELAARSLEAHLCRQLRRAFACLESGHLSPVHAS